MNVQPIEKGVNKWHDQKNQAAKATATASKQTQTQFKKQQKKSLKSNLNATVSNFDWNTISALALCWAFFYAIYFMFFGFSVVIVDNAMLAMYYLTQSLGGLLSITLVFFSSAFVQRKSTITQKLASVVFLVLTALDVIMAIDAYKNLYAWEALDSIYDFIHGDAKRIVAFGAKDAALLVLGVMCMNLSFTWFARR